MTHRGEIRRGELRQAGSVAPWRFRLRLSLVTGGIEAGLIFVVWKLTGWGDLANAMVGAFLGIFILVGLTPTGRDMTTALYVRRSMKHLGRADRREVSRAVREGRAVGNPALAPFAVRESQQARRSLERLSARPPLWIVLGALALSATAITRGNLGGAVVFLVLLLAWPLPRRRARELARRATGSEVANQQLLDGLEGEHGKDQ